MNERIQLLAKQATRPRGPNKPAEFDKEYFARLIVQECYMWAKENGGIPTDVDHCALKEHFGIK